MTAVSNEMQAQAATMRLSDAMKASTEVMQMMNSVVNVPETHEAMAAMRQEMMKAGLIEELIDEGMEDLDGPDLEEEAEQEVDRVLADLAIDAAMRLAITRPDDAEAQAAAASGAPAAAAAAAPARVAVPGDGAG
eukprot:CAMPEP_0170363490 /NCGR_PEP_ID=MMETSP0117_2-20130122/4882_1 /TAXON_ID=400756 /ORGANISM="Durinskia baltica, Strain CSIRO CS-38" /LENGTH=134 /DNA_ID=CAMNT_0010617955 /DNA_START=89 /DNA_END=493 /DNA_ORIENTATION=-